MKATKKKTVWGWQIVTNKGTKETLLNENMLYLLDDVDYPSNKVTAYFAYDIPKKVLKQINKLYKKSPTKMADFLYTDFIKPAKARKISWFVVNDLTRAELVALVKGDSITKEGKLVSLADYKVQKVG